MKKYVIVADRLEGKFDLWCEDVQVGSYSNLADAQTERERLEAEDEDGE